MTLQHPKSFKLSILFFLSLLLLFAHYAFAQYPITKVHGSFCSGSEAGFIIAASSCSYVNWSASGAQILEQNGTYVRVKWTSTSAQISCSYYCNYQSGSSYSPWYSISSPATPSVSISANKNNVCSGTSITFTATPTNGGSSPYYNWRVNGATAPGATNSRYYTTSRIWAMTYWPAYPSMMAFVICLRIQIIRKSSAISSTSMSPSRTKPNREAA